MLQQAKPQKTLLIIDFPDAVLTITPKELKLIADNIDTILIGNIGAVPKEYHDYVGAETIKLAADKPTPENLLLWREALTKIISERPQYDEVVFVSPHFWKARAVFGTNIKFRYGTYLRRLINNIITGTILEKQ